MRKIIFKDPDKIRTSKTKRWLGWLTFCMMLFVGQIGFAQSVGTDCSVPIVVGALPYTTTDNTANYTDNPSIEGSPGASGCGTTSSYLNGNDVVYAYTAAFDGVIQVKMTPTGTWSGIFAYANCADIGTACIGGASNTGTAVNMFELNVTNGETYYFVISTWAAPQTVGYTLDISQILCPKPTGVTHTDVTHNSANVSWDVSGNYEINWGPSSPTFTAGDGVNTNTVNATTEFAFSGLNGSTSYRYFVRQNCGSTNGNSDWVGPYTFTTLVAPASIPWLEGFATTTIPTGWTQTGFSFGVATGITNAPGGVEGNVIYKNLWGSGASGNFQTIRVGTVSSGDILSFVYKSNDYGSPYAPPPANSGSFIVAVSTDNGANYTNIDTIINDGISVGWQNLEYDLSAYSGQYVQIKISATRTAGDYYLAFDNFYVGQPITCVSPTALTATNITANTADLGWTSDGTLFDIEWGPQGFAQGTGTIVSGISNPYTLGGLDSQTSYSYYVRQDCGTVDGKSMWAGPFSFMTACEVPDAPEAITFTSVTATGTTINVTAPENAPTGYVIFRSTSNMPPVLTNGTVYTASQTTAVTSLTSEGSTYFCVYNGTGLSGTATSLTSNTQYYYYVYSKNGTTSSSCYGAPWYSLEASSGSQITAPATPTSFVASNVGFDTATVSWTASAIGGDAATLNYLVEVYTDSGYTTPIMGSPFSVGAELTHSLSGLAQGTTYFVRIKATNGQADSAYLSSGFATTQPGQVGSGVTTASNFPVYSGTAYNYTQQIYTKSQIETNLEEGQNFITKIKFFYNGSASGIAPSTTPPTTTTFENWTVYLGNTDKTSFATTTDWVTVNEMQQSFSGTVTFSTPGSWMEILLDTPFQWDGESNIVVAVDENSPGTLFTAYFRSFTSDTNTGIYRRIGTDIDPATPGTATSRTNILAQIVFSAIETPSCMPPTTLLASNILTNSADISWSSEGSNFDIEWGTQGFVQGQGATITGVSNPYTLGGLNPQTSYSYYVRQNCGGSSGTSPWSGPYSFMTTCVAADLPYFEDFDSVTIPNLPSCTNIETLNGTLWRTSSSSATGMIGNKLNYSYHPSGTGTADAWFYTPGLNLEAGKNYAISYKYGNNTTVYTERMKVAYGTSASVSAMNEVLADHNAISTATALENEVFFTVAEDGVYYFGFQSYSIANQNQLFVDDILIKELENPCTGTPDAGIATISMDSGVSGSTVDFAVTGYDNTTEGLSYDWEYSTDSGASWESTGVSDDEVTFTISGPIGTVFQVRYAVTCSFSESTGYSNELTFTVTQPLNYCTPTYASVDYDDRLSAVTTTGAVSNLNYSNTVRSQHFDMTTMILETTPGQQFTLNTTYVGGEQTVGVWIDWEHNNTFDDLGNRIDIKHSTLAGKSFIITIPSDATLGDYRLRVRGSYSNHVADGDAFACNSKSYGSSVDFTIRVAAPCSAEWTGAVSTDWNTAGNWCDNTVPTAGSDVVINVANAAVISTDVSVASITLGAAANVTVNGSLNVGDISVAAGGSLIVANDANLFQSETAVNSGNIIVKRNAVIKHLDYTIWSSPVVGQGLAAFSPNTLASRIYEYNTSSDAWVITSGNFVAGKGIMFRAPNLFNDGYYPNAYTYQGTFTGTPHNGDITMNFAQVGTYQGVGNPYPSNMDIEEFWINNAGTGTLYFWTNTNAWDSTLNAGNGDYVANNWATYSDLGGLPAANSTKEPDSSVPVGQGFVVEATGLNSVSFNNDMRTAQSGVFFRTAVQDKHRLWLNLSDTSNELNNLLIGYMNGATQGEDLRIDSKMFNYEGSALYSLIDGSQSAYVIQGRSLPFDDFDVVPLGFRAATSSSFTISLANFDGLFAQGQDIFLKDNLTQTQHNLKDGAYTFVSAQGEFTTRFEVVYRSSMDVNVPELDNAWVVYAKDKTFFIETQGFDMKEVVMYDMLGRVVYQSKAEGNSHTIAQEGANQVLIIKVITADNQVLTKKVNN